MMVGVYVSLMYFLNIYYYYVQIDYYTQFDYGLGVIKMLVIIIFLYEFLLW